MMDAGPQMNINVFLNPSDYMVKTGKKSRLMLLRDRDLKLGHIPKNILGRYLKV